MKELNTSLGKFDDTITTADIKKNEVTIQDTNDRCAKYHFTLLMEDQTNLFDPQRSQSLIKLYDKNLENAYNSTIQTVIQDAKKGVIVDAKTLNPYIDEFTKSNDITQWNKGYYLWYLTHLYNMPNSLEKLPNSFLMGIDSENNQYVHQDSLGFFTGPNVKYYWAPKRSRAESHHYHFPEYRIYKDFYSKSAIAREFSRANEWLDTKGTGAAKWYPLVTAGMAVSEALEYFPNPAQPYVAVINKIARPAYAAYVASNTASYAKGSVYNYQLKNLERKKEALEIKGENLDFMARKARDPEMLEYYTDNIANNDARIRNVNKEIANTKYAAAASSIAKIGRLAYDTFKPTPTPLPPIQTRIPTSTISSAPMSSGGGGGSSFKSFYGQRNRRSRRRNQRRLRTYYPRKRYSRRRRYSKKRFYYY